MDKSLFSAPSTSKSRLLSASNLELPRWRSPSPLSTSIIPPPIVQSTYAAPPQRLLAQSIIVPNPSTNTFKDRQEELEADLQFLLDAQADSLAGGLDGTLAAEHASTGSTTPTALSVRSTSQGAGSRRRGRRKPGIRSARKGIYNSILALSAVKGEEIEDLEAEVRGTEERIEKLEGWTKKKEGLLEAREKAQAEEDTVRCQRLRKEADALQVEINHVELQLADMKARQRKLLREAMAAENAVEAKMASYTSSLRLLEEDVQKFLSINATERGSRTSSSDGTVSIWQIPPTRRTLDMAKQHWSDERKSFAQQRENVEVEKAALDEGALMWKEVVMQLTDFERFLRTQMTASTAKAEWPSAEPELLARMDAMISDLDSKFELAISRRWNLLIAALGAELDALRQGRQLLGGAEPDNDDPGTGSSTANGENLQNSSSAGNDLEASRQTVTQRPRNSPEDDPDPELLFSRHDNDSE